MILSAGFLPLLSFFLGVGLWLVQVELHDSWYLTKDVVWIVMFLPLLEVMLTVALAVGTTSRSRTRIYLHHVTPRRAPSAHPKPRSYLSRCTHATRWQSVIGWDTLYFFRLDIILTVIVYPLLDASIPSLVKWRKSIQVGPDESLNGKHIGVGEPKESGGAQGSADERRPSIAQTNPGGTGSFGSGPSRSVRRRSGQEGASNAPTTPAATGGGQRPTLLATLGNRSSLTTMSVTDLNAVQDDKRTKGGAGVGASGGGTADGKPPVGAAAGGEAGDGAGYDAGKGIGADRDGDGSEGGEEAEPDWIDKFSLAHVTGTGAFHFPPLSTAATIVDSTSDTFITTGTGVITYSERAGNTQSARTQAQIPTRSLQVSRWPVF